MKRTYQPKKRHRKMEHGFRKRMADRTAARYLLVAEEKAESNSLIKN